MGKKLIRFDWTLKKLLRHKANFDIANSIYSVYSLSNQTVVEEIVMRPQLGDIV